MHIPVMPTEVLEYLAVKANGRYLDATTGMGGHTAEIARRLETGTLIACDRDAESLEMARSNVGELAGRIHFRKALFSELDKVLESMGGGKLDGLLADLGASRYQLTDAERGFSFNADAPLDMRMDRSQGPTASDLVNCMSEQALADLIYNLGEERRSRRITRAIVRARPLHSTQDLVHAVERAVPRTGRLHPATQTFMALRIAVNREQEELDRLLEIVPKIVAVGGRVVIITFMSLEDRKVKRSFQALAREGRARILTRHVIRPREEEVSSNPASRSAKLRALEVIEEER
ncbi:MAG: 16S rRNA (cytosine(1402)-N(4))-methyltransferase RsmH [Acidobacteriales bacterium]|nr:16S rRNA (cytosine(1402)-N(4))-methyltransferase RsmH [Terriglobales bacterium]